MPPPVLRLGSWAVLALLLAATLAGALTFDRRSWPGLVGDEATYLNAFMDARVVEMNKEEAHSDTTRVDTAQRSTGPPTPCGRRCC